MKPLLIRITLLLGIFISTSFVCFAQDNNSDKVVTLNISGEGSTKQEALQTALRGAIEQAFGTFISSNTQVLNDELTKDEIVSISNGNIQKYEIISEVQLPNGQFANTVKATVSVSKLTSFCENKGITVEFKGALFTLNIKQKLLNEQNEVKAIKDMCKILKEISDRSFDYEIKASEPIQKGTNYAIPIEINIKVNKNLELMNKYLSSTLYNLSLPKQEIEEYTKLEKNIYIVSFEKLVYLRKEESIKALADLFFYFRQSVLNFSIKDGSGAVIKGTDLVNYREPGYRGYYPNIKAENFKPLYLKGFYASRGILFSSYDHSYSEWGSYSRYWVEESNIWPKLNEYKQFDIKFSLSKFQKGQTVVSLIYKDVRSLDELNKISAFSIIPNY